MSHRYAPVQNTDPRDAELHAAFDDSDDEEDNAVAESRPLNPHPTTPQSPRAVPQPGAYNFEAVDYDFPPPGSPPPPSATALPNSIGNTNGFIPSFDSSHRPQPQRKWYQRAATAILPSSVVTSLGIVPKRPSGPVGGGTGNDGVFANVMAKPSAPVTIRDGDDVYVVPEITQAEAPPSYASAQADAVPPYWETTVHTPFAPDSMGELLIDSMPTGSLFSFCWNLLVSVSFQFVGFLLTYLLHTSHAARLGSRAGLGITLIQYGFAIRNQQAEQESEARQWTSWDNSMQGSSSTDNGNGMLHHHHRPDVQNLTWSTPIGNMTEEQANEVLAGATAEWLSFFLMTIGWFILLTSVLGFWRLKRWERGVLASRGEPSTAAPSTARPGVSRAESSFGLRGMSRIELLRQGFGFGGHGSRDQEQQTQPGSEERNQNSTRSAASLEEGRGRGVASAGTEADSRETDPMMPPEAVDEEERTRIARARVMAYEQNLQRALRDAGF